MSWRTWKYSADEASVAELADMIYALMHEVSFEMDDPDLDEWFDAGIELEDNPFGDESIIVYHEMQETDMTDVDGTYKPGYTLTLQMCDGQQDTQAFFADDDPAEWEDISRYFAERVAKGFEPRY